MSSRRFPRYFLIDGLPVRVDLDGDEVFGMTWNGREYPPLKALSEGREVDKDEYESASKDREHPYENKPQ